MTRAEVRTGEATNPRLDRAAGLLLVIFASAYFGLGPGNFFSVDEVLLQQTASSIVARGNAEVAAMNTALRGRSDAHYTTKGPGLPWCALPFAALGRTLDRAFGSMNGGLLAGPPLGVMEHPLRWGGRPTIPAMLAANALIGGACVALLFRIGVRLTGDPHTALRMAAAAGAATLLASEATHFFQHPLQALGALLALWFLGGGKPLHGGLALGVTLLSGAESGALVVALAFYGVIVAAHGASPARIASNTLRLALGPALAALAFLRFNEVRFESLLRFGYNLRRGTASLQTTTPAFDMDQSSTVFWAYAFGPANSILLFSPPLLLAIVSLRAAWKRWPLETTALLVAFFAQLYLISTYGGWHGSLGYGPRFMLAPILLVMPLTLPAFARRGVFTHVPTAAGVAVAGLGIAIYVAANQWFRAAEGISDWRSVVTPAAPPILVHLRFLLRGEHLAPWVIRAVRDPGTVLMFWMLLAGLVGLAFWRLRGIARNWGQGVEDGLRAVSSSPLAGGILGVIVLLLCGGAFATKAIDTPRQERVGMLLGDAIAAQLAGRDVEASELYAIVLGLDRSHAFAHYDLGVLAHQAGRTTEAIRLYRKALALDPALTPALDNLSQLVPSLNVQRRTTPNERYPVGSSISRRAADAENEPETE